MGNPILRPEPDPLPHFKGYFVAHVTQHEVGTFSPDVFVAEQRQAAAGAFIPLVSIDGGILHPGWAGQRLFWLYGALNEGGAFFRLQEHARVEYLGTARHPTPDWLGFDGGERTWGERPVSPGYVEYVPSAESDGEGSSDDEGYHDAPAVLAGGEPPLPPEERPCCLRCQQSMAYVGQVESDCFSDDLLDDVRVMLFFCSDCCIQCCMNREL